MHTRIWLGRGKGTHELTVKPDTPAIVPAPSCGVMVCKQLVVLKSQIYYHEKKSKLKEGKQPDSNKQDEI